MKAIDRASRSEISISVFKLEVRTRLRTRVSLVCFFAIVFVSFCGGKGLEVPPIEGALKSAGRCFNVVPRVFS